MKEPILITGIARSGTSMVAGVINLCGVFMGTLAENNRANPKGMFENAEIRNNMVKPFLRSCGADPAGQFPLPDTKRLPIPGDWRQNIEQVMIKQGYIGGAWAYKGPKMPLMWPVWNHAFPTAKWIIVRRRSGDIVRSCMRTAFMHAYHNERIQHKIKVCNEYEGWLWWIRQYEKRFVEMIQEGMNCKIIWPDRMVHGNYSQLFETLEWLGIEYIPHIREIYDFIEPKLWKARVKV